MGLCTIILDRSFGPKNRSSGKKRVNGTYGIWQIGDNEQGKSSAIRTESMKVIFKRVGRAQGTYQVSRKHAEIERYLSELVASRENSFGRNTI